jgi:hypothetical protein
MLKFWILAAAMRTCLALDTPSHAFVIALDPAWGGMLAARISSHLALSSVDVIAAHNGSGVSLPLYTRFLVKHGRYEHKQIGNKAMVGCFLSHVAAWRRVKGWAYVFEEDAFVDQATLWSVSRLLREVRDFSILMLQARRFEAEGSVRVTGPLAATCDACTWFGTRGYIVTEAGAGILLEHFEPIVTQVDALIGLVNEFDPRFRLVWTQRDIVGNAHSFASTVWDGCLLACFAMAIHTACLLFLAILCALLILRWRKPKVLVY